MKDYYQVLELDSSAGADQIKKAYRRLAREHHPDRNPGNARAEERFKEIREAYSVLSDPERKRQYDQMRRNPFGQFQEGFRSPGQSQTSDANGSFFSFDPGVGWDDILGGAGSVTDFFGRMFGGEPQQRTTNRTRRRTRTPQTNLTATVPFDLALRGGKTEVSLPDGRKIRINIPKGMEDGFKIRLKGQGAAAPGGAPGDVFVTFRVEPHPVYRRNGSDLLVDIDINPFEAMLGTTRSITTPQGKQVKVTVPQGAQTGDKLRLRGLGVETERQTGDLFVVVNVRTPKNLTAEQKRAVQEAAKKGGWLK